MTLDNAQTQQPQQEQLRDLHQENQPAQIGAVLESSVYWRSYMTGILPGSVQGHVDYKIHQKQLFCVLLELSTRPLRLDTNCTTSCCQSV